jgi:ankyrin repeat protein
MALSLALPLSEVQPFRLDEMISAEEPWTDTALFGSASELRKIDRNRRTAAGTAALMLAAGDEKKVRLLLDNGADVNAVAKSGYSALMVASSYGGNAGAIRLLLRDGARLDPDPAVKVLSNRTALMQAVISGDLENVKALIAGGADIQRTSLVFGGYSARPLVIAVFLNDLPTVGYLAARGAALNEADQDGVTVLDRAAMFGRADMVALLGSLGGNPNTVDKRGMTPLIWASTVEFGNAETVSRLLAAGARADLAGKDGVTPLTQPEKYGLVDVQTLLRANAKGPK